MDPTPHTPHPKPRHRWLALWLLVVLGMGLRVWLMAEAVAVGSDAARYYLPQAEAVSRGDLANAFQTDIPPLYPVLGGLAAMVVGDVEWACRIVSGLAGLALVWAVYGLARRLFGQGAALGAAALAAFHPYLCRFSADVGVDSLGAAAVAGTAWLLVEYLHRPAVRWAVPLGAVLAALALTRPEGFAYTPVVLVLMVIFGLRPPASSLQPSLRRRSLHAAVCAAVLLLPALPRLVWMHQRTGAFCLDERQVTWSLRVWESVERGEVQVRQPDRPRHFGLAQVWDLIESTGAALGPAAIVLGLYGVWRRRLPWSPGDRAWEGRPQDARRTEWVPLILIAVGIVVIFLGNRINRRYLLGAGAVWQAWAGAGLALLAADLARRTAFRISPLILVAAIAMLQAPFALTRLMDTHGAEKEMGLWIRDHYGRDQRILVISPIPVWYARGLHVVLPRPDPPEPRMTVGDVLAQAAQTRPRLALLDSRAKVLSPEMRQIVTAGLWPQDRVVHSVSRPDGTVLRLIDLGASAASAPAAPASLPAHAASAP